MSTTIETIIVANYPKENILETSQLAADANAGQAAATLLNINNIANNDFIVLSPGNEISEIMRVQSISGEILTFTQNLSLKHRNREIIYKLFGDTIRVYRASNVDGTIPLDSAFTLLGSTLIDCDQADTSYSDSAGGSDYWYKSTYYNSVTQAEMDLSLSVAVRGGGWGAYASIDEIRIEAGVDLVSSLSDTDIAAIRVGVESEIDGSLTAAGYTLPLQTQKGAVYTPEIIILIDRLMSAGIVLQRNFGITKAGSSKNGETKAAAGRDLLAKIAKNTIILVDSNKQALAKPNLLDGYPDDTNQTVDPDGRCTTGPIFSMNKQF